jgi:cobalamin biosynthesis protein CobD/CbiB
MDLAALILALLIEQGRSMPHHNPVWDAARATTQWFNRNFNAGDTSHGRTAWLVYISLTLISSGALWWLLDRIHPVLGFTFNVVCLLFTLGFRRFSHHYTVIEDAARVGDIDALRKELAQWYSEQDIDIELHSLPISRLIGLAMEEGLVAAHRSVFGTMFWFAVLPGPIGALGYRLADHLARTWNRALVPGQTGAHAFGAFASQAFEWIDWLPARLSALAFAVVGNFEDAMHLWRNRALRFGTDTRALLISAGAGAMGVELGPVQAASEDNGLDWSGIEPSVAAMKSGAGLIWRATVLWLTLIALWTVAQWFG